MDFILEKIEKITFVNKVFFFFCCFHAQKMTKLNKERCHNRNNQAFFKGNYLKKKSKKLCYS